MANESLVLFCSFVIWLEERNMTTDEYRQLWMEAIHLCEIEPKKEEALSFVMQYYDCGDSIYYSMDDRSLLLTFIGLVVYEKKYLGARLGSTTPTSFCYRELLKRIETEHFDKEFIYDVGDWAADYADNSYVPMGNYRGYGPRQYFAFWHEYESRVALEKQAKEERIERKRAEGRVKVKAAKLKHQERLNTIQQLREETIENCILIIENSSNSVFYYYELIEDWFKKNALNDIQKVKVLSFFPLYSTRHNNRKRKFLESISNISKFVE